MQKELMEKYQSLTEAQQKEIDIKMEEHFGNLLRGGPLDIAHWHKVPPSPTVAVEETPAPAPATAAKEVAAATVEKPARTFPWLWK